MKDSTLLRIPGFNVPQGFWALQSFALFVLGYLGLDVVERSRLLKEVTVARVFVGGLGYYVVGCCVCSRLHRVLKVASSAQGCL